MNKTIKLAVAFMVFFISTTNFAQLSVNEKKEILSNIGRILEDSYVFPKMAETMKIGIMEHFVSGKYDAISDDREFAFQLTNDLREISKDLHLSVSYSQNEISTDSIPTELELKEQLEWMDTILKENRYGVTNVEVLEGNIGYMELPIFGPLAQCADTLVAAIRKIENTKALILDLRNCRGSLDENTIPFLCSFFFKEPVHLFDFYTRRNNSTKQFWTYAWLPYKKYVDKPIYVLTSRRTFSGGEELAYDLKQQKRAKLIGETTKGGANPNQQVPINKHYAIAVPYMQAINPISKTNWEGIGVVPDSIVKSNMALYTGHLWALKTILKFTTDTAQKIILADQIQKVQTARPEFRKVQFILEGYTNAKEVVLSGSFNFWETDLKMTKRNDKWVAEAEVKPGTISYKFIVDGRWITDPANPNTHFQNGYVNSLLEVN
ncbi:S41 family peptidase [Kriegella aquimaris]|uniref:N-terminal domain of Peptidase_S41 n=1 Tax=Kriegella aquimaris TaxID=192904 RepID=A0A1G9SA37_9FLAO|nr:S41 family peptidase [Kriegella aquimaris]SDM31645.1 N-terminal domain of Peptidase_S41 [Kriegella aquimaris]